MSVRNPNFDFLLAADLQLQERREFGKMENGLNSRLVEGIDIVNQIGELAAKHNIKRVFILGDVFELKDRIPARIMILFAEAIDKYPCPVTVLKGNHDFAEDDYPPIKLLVRGGKLDFIQKPIIKRFLDVPNEPLIAFLPYYRKYEEFKIQWNHLHKEFLTTDEKPKLFLFHNTVPGAAFSNNRKAEGEFDLETIDGIRYLAGDIHLPQMVGRVQYLGSPYQVDFGEEGQQKFVYLLDSTDNILRPVELNYPKFISININDVADFTVKVTHLVKDNYIRITGEVLKEQKHEVDELREKLKDLVPKFVVSAVKYHSDKKARLETESKDAHAVLSEFIDKADTTLEKTKLLEFGLSLIKEVQA